MAKKKLCLLITNLGEGGAQRVFHDHSKMFSDKFEVIEVVFNKNESQNLYPSSNKMYSLDVKKGNNVITKLSNFFLRCKRLRKIIKDENISICISHMDGANWVNILSFSQAKKLLVVHGTVLYDQNQNRLFQLFRTNILIPFIYNKATKTITVSEAIKNELQQRCDVKNVLSIPNFFDISSIRKRSDESLNLLENELFQEHLILITSGRLAEQKKQRFLFPLFKKIKPIFDKAKLVLLGDGELRNELITSAKESDLSVFDIWSSTPFHNEYDVYFLGYVQNPYKYLRKSHLFLFPSAWEGFPMALCEAITVGIPVLSADCPTGPRQILNPESLKHDYDLKHAEWSPSGVLLPMYDKESFSDEWLKTIKILIDDEQRRKEMVANASLRIKDFEKEKVIKQWISLVDNCIKY